MYLDRLSFNFTALFLCLVEINGHRERTKAMHKEIFYKGILFKKRMLNNYSNVNSCK